MAGKFFAGTDGDGDWEWTYVGMAGAETNLCGDRWDWDKPLWGCLGIGINLCRDDLHGG